MNEKNELRKNFLLLMLKFKPFNFFKVLSMSVHNIYIWIFKIKISNKYVLEIMKRRREKK